MLSGVGYVSRRMRLKGNGLFSEADGVSSLLESSSRLSDKTSLSSLPSLPRPPVDGLSIPFPFSHHLYHIGTWHYVDPKA